MPHGVTEPPCKGSNPSQGHVLFHEEILYVVREGRGRSCFPRSDTADRQPQGLLHPLAGLVREGWERAGPVNVDMQFLNGPLHEEELSAESPAGPAEEEMDSERQAETEGQGSVKRFRYQA